MFVVCCVTRDRVVVVVVVVVANEGWVACWLYRLLVCCVHLLRDTSGVSDCHTADNGETSESESESDQQ